MFDYTPLTETMRNRREKVEDIARLLNLSVDELRVKLEDGRFITMAQLHRLCEHFECNPDRIIEWLPSAEYIKLDWGKVASFGRPLTVLSVQCGMSRSSLYNTSRGTGRVKAENAKKIADVLGCCVEDLID